MKSSNQLPRLKLSLQFALPTTEAAKLRPVLARHKVNSWLKHALAAGGSQDAELTVRIVDAVEGRRLNNEFRHKDYATNVLTFDYSHQPIVYADLVLCADVIAKEAAEQGKELMHHYAHLLIHGCLHAQGYDHILDAEAAVMEALECRVMAHFAYPNPYMAGN